MTLTINNSTVEVTHFNEGMDEHQPYDVSYETEDDTITAHMVYKAIKRAQANEERI